MQNEDFTALGKSGVNDIAGKLDTFEAPEYVTNVLLTSDEVTAVCPVTGQPDQYTVTIDLVPNGLLIESKSLKLYLQSFRNEGVFCEALSTRIASHIMEQTTAISVTVKVTQKSRGGISITAESYINERDMPQDRGPM